MNKSSLFYRSNRISSIFSSHGLSTWGVLLLLTGCTTNFSPGSLIKTNALPASNPNAGTSDPSNQGAFVITQVAVDRTFTSLLNVIGDQSGAIGTFCSPSDGSAASPTNTTCMCTYAYNTPSAPNQQIDVPMAYYETDLARCPLTTLPGDTTQVTISIHVTSADLYSNSITYSVGTSSNTLDTTDISSFFKITRFQCRDKVWIPYIFDSTIYDPYQSEDPHLAYPLDFYTNNIGASMAVYAGAVDTHPGLEYWDCPPIFTPEKYLSLNPANVDEYEKRFNLNMWIYSWGSLGPRGDNRIYPPTKGSFDRSTFYLAKSSSGAFSVAVNAYIAPLIISGTTDYPSPLGYGARPIVTSGSGTDNCPNAIPIPKGYHWVKVWLFRAALPPRQYIVPGDLGGESLNSINSILCNPGTWLDPVGGTNQTPIFPSCTNPLSYTYNSNPSTAYDYIDPSPSPTASVGFIMSKYWESKYYLTSRVVTYDESNILAASSCVNLQDFVGSWLSGLASSATHTPQDCSRTPNHEIPGTGCGGDFPTDYADFWELSPTGNLGTNKNHDPLGLHQGNSVSTPSNRALKTESLDTDSNRYDFLFVVSPPELSLTDMVDTTPSSPGLPYQPYRFYLDSDCASRNPDNPTITGDCDKTHNAITTYGVKRHDVSTNGDTPPTGSLIPWVFPVCAIQPDTPQNETQ